MIAGDQLLPYVLFDLALGVLVLSSVFLPQRLVVSSVPAASFVLVLSSVFLPERLVVSSIPGPSFVLVASVRRLLGHCDRHCEHLWLPAPDLASRFPDVLVLTAQNDHIYRIGPRSEV